jgi:hypothetical protein
MRQRASARCNGLKLHCDQAVSFPFLHKMVVSSAFEKGLGNHEKRLPFQIGGIYVRLYQ